MYGKPKDAAMQNAENAFAAMIMDPKVQSEWVGLAGGIPARNDADKSSLDACMSNLTAAASDPDKSVTDPSMTMEPDMTGRVTDVVVAFWNDDSMTVDQFVKNMQDAISG
jgi:glucose/mannose transport system substrate-binding protein